MADLEMYGVENANGEGPDVLYHDIDQARSAAIRSNGKLIAYLYSLDDSELVEDYADSPR